MVVVGVVVVVRLVVVVVVVVVVVAGVVVVVVVVEVVVFGVVVEVLFEVDVDLVVDFVVIFDNEFDPPSITEVESEAWMLYVLEEDSVGFELAIEFKIIEGRLWFEYTEFKSSSLIPTITTFTLLFFRESL